MYLEVAIGEHLSPSLFGMLVEHDGKVFIDGHEFGQWFAGQQLAGAAQ